LGSVDRDELNARVASHVETADPHDRSLGPDQFVVSLRHYRPAENELSRERLKARCRAARSLIRRRSACTNATTPSGGTSRPVPAGSVSGIAPAMVDTTGNPCAIASASTIPSLETRREHKYVGCQIQFEDSSLIAVPDLMYRVSMVTQQEMRPLPLYSGAALTYFGFVTRILDGGG
jgi:hypothetical protein